MKLLYLLPLVRLIEIYSAAAVQLIVVLFFCTPLVVSSLVLVFCNTAICIRVGEREHYTYSILVIVVNDYSVLLIIDNFSFAGNDALLF